LFGAATFLLSLGVVMFADIVQWLLIGTGIGLIVWVAGT
jgi:hypothetical protein